MTLHSAPDRTKILMSAVPLAAASTKISEEIAVPQGIKSLSILASIVVAGGGTTCKVFVQTSIDSGDTWVDIMAIAFLTTTAKKISSVRLDIAVAGGYVPTDGTLADDTIKDGIIGDRIRVKEISTGTYTGNSHITVKGVFN